MNYRRHNPEIAESTFIARGARVVGKVEIGLKSSVWFNAVLRGDKDEISIGEYSNVQDNATVHTTAGYPVGIGSYVSVGHNCTVHGAEIGNNVLIGMQAVVMNGAEVGENSIVAAGALVTENSHFPKKSLILGFPARVKRELTREEVRKVKSNALSYARLAEEYMR